ncbi:MAG: hypothetical protein ACPG80_05450 [Rickettsiales bacterium]
MPEKATITAPDKDKLQEGNRMRLYHKPDDGKPIALESSDDRKENHYYTADANEHIQRISIEQGFAGPKITIMTTNRNDTRKLREAAADKLGIADAGSDVAYRGRGIMMSDLETTFAAPPHGENPERFMHNVLGLLKKTHLLSKAEEKAIEEDLPEAVKGACDTGLSHRFDRIR